MDQFFEGNHSKAIEDIRNNISHYVGLLCIDVHRSETPGTSVKYIERYAIIDREFWIGEIAHRHFGDPVEEKKL
jgi:hypothetical protein